MDESIKQILAELLQNSLDAKERLVRIENKLDAVYQQVATNTEFDTVMKELAITVDEHGTDIKLIKKLLSNQ